MADRGLDMILLGREGEYELSEQTIAALRYAYPDKNVDRELALMHLWLLSNAARRPVLLLKFVKAWLKRAKAYNPTKEARRANIAGLCGWNHTPSVDDAIVRPPSLGVWESDGEHVGGVPPSGHH